MVEGEIEGVKAIDLDSGGEARNVSQLWMGTAGLVRRCGIHLSCVEFLKVRVLFVELCIICWLLL